MASTKRKQIRDLKRAVSRLGNADALLALLDRSIRFGHKRLALLRWFEAVKLGIGIPEDSLHYCRRLLAGMPADEVHGLCLQTGVLDPHGKRDDYNALIHRLMKHG